MIGSATAADASEVVALWEECGLTRPWNEPYADFKRALEGATSAVLVIHDDTAIIASVMVGHDGHRGWVYYLAVVSTQRGEGLGRKLMTAAEDWFRARAVPKIQLMVRDGNDAAIGFYHALGYEPQPVAVFGRFLD